MANRKNVIVPELDHDAYMSKQFGTVVSVDGRIERRIVAALCAHLVTDGWHPHLVNDGENEDKVTDAKSAMELIFNLDEAWLFFRDWKGNQHYVYIVLGNGVDCICDWSYAKGDKDGFSALMDKFDPEQYL